MTHLHPSPAAALPALNQIYFYLTEGCNLACRHCWLAPKLDANGSRYPVLPVELFDRILHEARPLGLSGVKLTGGEPLLHPLFSQLLQIVRREDLALTVETNGMLCTREVAVEIARSPNCFVSVSLDGADAVTHEWVRGVPGSFAGAQQGIRNLAAAGIAPQIIMTVMRGNAEQVEAVVHLAEQLGAASVKFNPVQPTARGEKVHQAGAALSIAESIALGRRVEMELARSTRLRLFFDYPLAFRPLSRIQNGDGCSVCGIHGILGVLPSGQYALCGIGERVPELIFGQGGIDRLETVWRENETLRAIRENIPSRLEGVCRDCLMKASCLGSCIAQNYYRRGSLYAPFWFCERARAEGLYPPSRLAHGAEHGSIATPDPNPALISNTAQRSQKG